MFKKMTIMMIALFLATMSLNAGGSHGNNAPYVEFKHNTELFSVYEDADPNDEVGTNLRDKCRIRQDNNHSNHITFSENSVEFDINHETGQLFVAPGAVLDYETTEQYTFTVTAKHSYSSTHMDTVEVTIDVLDVDEPDEMVTSSDPNHKDKPSGNIFRKGERGVEKHCIIGGNSLPIALTTICLLMVVLALSKASSRKSEQE